MALITEAALRMELKNKSAAVYQAKKGDKITPAAMEYLRDRGIELRFNETGGGAAEDASASEKLPSPKQTAVQPPPEKKFRCYYTGAWFSEKPEFMTHFKGNELVYKDHPRLIFRGKVDSLEAQTLYTMAEIKESRTQIRAGLKEIYEYLRKIMRAEVLGEQLEEFSMLSCSPSRLREISHHPKKYFGQDHFILQGEEGREVLLLNILRTQVRELELEGIKAFRRENTVDREDILKSLNRLSSAVYVLMLKAMYED